MSERVAYACNCEPCRRRRADVGRVEVDGERWAAIEAAAARSICPGNMRPCGERSCDCPNCRLVSLVREATGGAPTTPPAVPRATSLVETTPPCPSCGRSRRFERGRWTCGCGFARTTRAIDRPPAEVAAAGDATSRRFALLELSAAPGAHAEAAAETSPPTSDAEIDPTSERFGLLDLGADAKSTCAVPESSTVVAVAQDEVLWESPPARSSAFLDAFMRRFSNGVMRAAWRASPLDPTEARATVEGAADAVERDRAEAWVMAGLRLRPFAEVEEESRRRGTWPRRSGRTTRTIVRALVEVLLCRDVVVVSPTEGLRLAPRLLDAAASIGLGGRARRQVSVLSSERAEREPRLVRERRGVAVVWDHD